MPRMELMTSFVSFCASQEAEIWRSSKSYGKVCEDMGFADLKAVDSTSLLGRHDGVIEDDLLDLLADSAA